PGQPWASQGRRATHQAIDRGVSGPSGKSSGTIELTRAPEMKHDVIVIGGGAAGLMCAIEAGKRGRSVVVLEHAERLGKKILISGGGRCNFTNINAGPENYLSANPHYCKSALARYRAADFIALVERHGI